MENKPRMVFMGGVPRSGTSLVQKILDMHSKVYAGPEFDFLPAICNLYANMKVGVESGRQVFYYDLAQLRTRFSDMISDLVAGRHASKAIELVCEKTPSNVLVFDALKELFPESKFIFVVRDPRANIASFMKVAERAGMFGDDVHLGTDLLKDLYLINNYIATGSRFAKENGDRCYVIHYEALLQNPETEVRSLCKFLDLPFEESMMNIGVENDTSLLVNAQHKTVRAWSTPGMLDTSIKPETADKWKKTISPSIARFVGHFFAARNYACYAVYGFKRMGKIERLSFVRLYLKNKGIGFIVKKAYGVLRNH